MAGIHEISALTLDTWQIRHPSDNFWLMFCFSEGMHLRRLVLYRCKIFFLPSPHRVFLWENFDRLFITSLHLSMIPLISYCSFISSPKRYTNAMLTVSENSSNAGLTLCLSFPFTLMWYSVTLWHRRKSPLDWSFSINFRKWPFMNCVHCPEGWTITRSLSRVWFLHFFIQWGLSGMIYTFLA